MANTRSAAKRARQTTRRTLANSRALSAVKTQLKKARAALKAGKKDDAKTSVQEFVSTIDKAVKAGRVHRNTAARYKSTLGKALSALN